MNTSSIHQKTTSIPGDQLAELSNRNCHAYNLLFEIEVTMREIIQILLQRAHGRRWLKDGIPEDVRQKIKSGIDYEKKVPWNKLTCHGPLYYIDFPDLKKITINGKNWPSAFEDVFLSKNLADGSLAEIEPIRNAVAHNRIVSLADVAVLEGSHTKLVQSLPASLRKAAIENAARIVPVVDSLTALRATLSDTLSAATEGRAVPASAAEICAKVEEWWWFDPLYLGPVDNLTHCIKLCGIYAEIPSGLGQALARRGWAEENKFCENLAECIRELDKITRN